MAMIEMADISVGMSVELLEHHTPLVGRCVRAQLHDANILENGLATKVKYIYFLGNTSIDLSVIIMME